MFSVMSVIPFRWTITYNALKHTIQGPPAPVQPQSPLGFTVQGTKTPWACPLDLTAQDPLSPPWLCPIYMFNPVKLGPYCTGTPPPPIVSTASNI